MLVLICVFALLVGASVKRAAAVYREREREREVVASVVTAACGENREVEVVASTLHHCILIL